LTIGTLHGLIYYYLGLDMVYWSLGGRRQLQYRKGFFMKKEKILVVGLIGLLMAVGLLLVECDAEGEEPSNSEPEPPPYNAAAWLGTWQGTNTGTINGSHIQITFTTNGMTESWTAPDGPRSYTIRFDKITPMWNYSNATKSDYPCGYVFQGTVTATVNSHELKSKTWHEFYINKANNAMLYDNSGTYAVFVKNH